MPSESSTHDRPVAAHCDDCGRSASERDGEPMRCACGSLLARYVDGGVELKCRRCKRTVVIPFETDEVDV